MKQKKKYLLCLLLLLSAIILLTACSKETLIYPDTGRYSKAYDNVTDQTTIAFYIDLYNESYLNVSSIEISFDYYLNDNKLGCRTIEYRQEIKHGEDYRLDESFIIAGEIDKIIYVSADFEYENFWQTYIADILARYWYLLLIIGIPLLIGLVFGIRDFLEEYWYIIVGIIVIAAIVCGFIFWKWQIMLWIVGGLLAAGIAAFIIYRIIENKNLDLYYYEQMNKKQYEQMTVAELKALCREYGISGFSALRKDEIIDLLKEHGEEASDNDGEEADNENTEAKASKSSDAARIPKIKLTDIAGLDDAKKALDERVILPLKHKDIYSKYGKKVGGGILLYGLPGTGKTMFAQAVATELDAKFFSIKCSDIESKWSGEAERNVKALFTEARRCKKAVIFFDEFDSLGARRQNNEDACNSHVTQEILTQMQGVEEASNMLL
ncbi:MAG: ATP-binding protein [Clostridiales bacterium]|jgi:DNA replication protein DnaC|nr:ATP-binding protein [Clostridiales bacterium]